MSGLYLIGVIALWLWLTSLLWKGLKRWRSTSGADQGARNGIAIVVALLWFAASFWYAGGRKFYFDWKVQEMCAVDGGIKVYEKVVIPADEFDRYGNYRVLDKKRAGKNDEYYYERNISYIRKGVPMIWRSDHKIIRRSDSVVVGEAIGYTRRGGDIPGPWHESSYTCPAITPARPSLEKLLFIMEDRK